VRCTVAVYAEDAGLDREEIEQLIRRAHEEFETRHARISRGYIVIDYVPLKRLRALLRAVRGAVGRRPV
jgi:hypothetical protein